MLLMVLFIWLLPSWIYNLFAAQCINLLCSVFSLYRQGDLTLSSHFYVTLCCYFISLAHLSSHYLTFDWWIVLVFAISFISNYAQLIPHRWLPPFPPGWPRSQNPPSPAGPATCPRKLNVRQSRVRSPVARPRRGDHHLSQSPRWCLSGPEGWTHLEGDEE